MKIQQEKREEPEKKDRKTPFSRFKGMLEKQSRVALAAMMVTFAVSCGDETGKDGSPDGGTDAQTDGGTTDTGTETGTDTGPTGLCAQFGEGHPNRLTMALGQEAKSGSEACEELLYFQGLTGEGDGQEANFGMYVPPSYPLVYWGLEVGDQKSVNFDGTGWTVVEVCEMTGGECERSFQTGVISGDSACTVTIAGDRPWVSVP